MSTAQSSIQFDRANKNRRLLLIAILLGVLAGALNFLSAARVSIITVLKAEKRIMAGTPVSESLFDKVTISGDLKQMRNLVVDAADFPKAFKDRPVAETLEAGQLLTLRSFDISGDDVRESIHQGQRAIAIDVPDEAQAVACCVKPGDGVDVWGWVNNTAQLLKQGACVRAVGEAYASPGEGEGGKERYRTVTLVVSDADVRGLVSNLTLAENKVRLSLVGPCDPKNEQPAMKPIEMPVPAKAGVGGMRMDAAPPASDGGSSSSPSPPTAQRKTQ